MKYSELEQLNKTEKLLNRAIQILLKVKDSLEEEQKEELENLINEYHQ